ncbi:uncharacterized protein LOC143636586 [Bidens hawaiensis]|uniref:uncharacterized protein LOC143636586 n=1 Tax=Bidens hawaiensis TaxID=980011 RepID=UPI00404B3CB0
MDKTRPTFVPEWLKNSGGSSASSSLHSDEQGGSKTVRNKSLEKDLGPFRRASINNGSAHSRSYSSFNRNQRDRGRDRDRDRDLDKDIFEFRNKERLESRRVDYSDPLGNILPTRFGKNGLRRSHSSLPGKRVESGAAKVGSDLSIVKKASFERDFPSLGVDNDIGKVTSAIQSLPVGNSGVIGGDGWTSALAEVPVIVGSNGNGSSVAPLVHPASVSGAAGGRNMAETLAQGPPRTQTPMVFIA